MLPAELVHLVCDYLFANRDAKGICRLLSLNQRFKNIVSNTYAYQIYRIISSDCQCYKPYCYRAYYILCDCQHHQNITVNRLSCLKYYHKFYPICEELFIIACKHNRLHIAEWSHKSFEMPRKTIHSAFIKVCERGCLNTLKWISETFDLNAEDIRSENNSALYILCQHGHLETAKWLVATFNLNDDDASSFYKYALCRACENDHLETAKWLNETFRLTIVGCLLPFYKACVNGRFEMVKWLASTFDIEQTWETMSYDILPNACCCGYLDILKLLLIRFNIEGTGTVDRLLNTASRNGHLEIVQFLHEKYPIDLISAHAILQGAYATCHAKVVEWLLKTFEFDSDVIRNIAPSSESKSSVEVGKLLDKYLW